MASWMREVLTNPLHGYYMNRDVFGSAGDFVTSPEISQMFGEMIGVWCVEMWQRMGQPKNLKLVEFGPGRGTLMKDVLRTVSCFEECKNSVEVFFIEISPHLRTLQAKSLGVVYPEQEKISVGKNTGLRMPAMSREDLEKKKDEWSWEGTSAVIENNSVSRDDGLKISWCQSLDDVPEGPVLIIAHEFFDALPVHHFQWTKNGWRERLVDINDDPESPDHFKFVLSPTPTLASASLMTKEFYPDLPMDPVLSEDKFGMNIEASSAAMAVAQDIGSRISKDKGAALIIDYGYDRPSTFSLRAIKEHKIIENVLENPGEADLSCDVDFSLLGRLAKFPKDKSDIKWKMTENQITSYGPVTQGEFLAEMGIDLRLAKLLAFEEDEQQAQHLVSSFDRITSPEQMGRIYKCLSIASNGLTTPPGFQQKLKETETTKE
eukprot:TRINITY_DN6531_c0_g1_i1.p1 TRINITY_DN6531_c0_g1~~TRINITY_DN6531_c0_g1_i1.p1  ORF type:complete len:495 (-),score=113.42 TRINITY_DN6531_c0_g1_i1:93-1391(-)